MEITRTGAATLNPAMDRTLEARMPQETRPTANNGATTKEPDEGAEAPSSLKAFAYGALDLEKPEDMAEETDSAYSAGEWLGAAAKVGGIISLLV